MVDRIRSMMKQPGAGKESRGPAAAAPSRPSASVGVQTPPAPPSPGLTTPVRGGGEPPRPSATRPVPAAAPVSGASPAVAGAPTTARPAPPEMPAPRRSPRPPPRRPRVSRRPRPGRRHRPRRRPPGWARARHRSGPRPHPPPRRRSARERPRPGWRHRPAASRLRSGWCPGRRRRPGSPGRWAPRAAGRVSGPPAARSRVTRGTAPADRGRAAAGPLRGPSPGWATTPRAASRSSR